MKPRPLKSRSRWMLAAVVVAGSTALLAVVWCWRNAVVEARALPARLISNSRPMPVSTCAECHPGQVNSFRRAPHMRTLRRGNTDEVVRLFAGREFQTGTGKTFRYEERDGWVWLLSTDYPEPLRVDWLFGSGAHARTPVSVRTTIDGASELLQHNVSWSPDLGLAPTLGIKPQRLDGYGIDAVAAVHNAAETEQCFVCHSSFLPIDEGRIQFDALQPAVACNRCHSGVERHVASGGQMSPAVSEWSRMTPLESVNRCGECHRRADQLTPDELVPENRQLVRFASVGLVQSACFAGQETLWRGKDSVRFRLDCLTCHDPHRPAEQDPAFYNARCLVCHGNGPHQAMPCPDQAMTTDCVSCHLGKVDIQYGLQFSDHWIRAQKPARSPAR